MSLPEAGARARERFSLEAETSRCRQRQAACPPLTMLALYQATTDDLYKLCEASLARIGTEQAHDDVVKVPQGTGRRSRASSPGTASRAAIRIPSSVLAQCSY